MIQVHRFINGKEGVDHAETHDSVQLTVWDINVDQYLEFQGNSIQFILGVQRYSKVTQTR